MLLRRWRESKGWTQEHLAIQLGLRSKGHVSRLERGLGLTTDLAIALDRLSDGALPVASLRPDLHDVRVVRTAAAPEARP